MGLCKCKKRTELFCFVHKKAVCDQCITTDHQVCVVKSYIEWLTDPEFEAPSCGICKGELVEGSMVRLLCLDMFHPECLDVYANSLPPNTAQAGYVCPTCTKPMLPPANNSGPIAQLIRAAFANSPWASLILPPSDPSEETDSSKDKSDNHSYSNHNHNHSNNYQYEAPVNPEASPSPSPASLSSQSSQPNSKDLINSQQYSPNLISTPLTPNSAQSQALAYNIEKQNSSNAASIYGVASRKPQSRTASSYPVDEEDEDKYKRKGIMQLFSALGLVSKPTGTESKRGMKLDPRRVLLLFALFASFATVLVLYLLVLENEKPVVTFDQDGPN